MNKNVTHFARVLRKNRILHYSSAVFIVLAVTFLPQLASHFLASLNAAQLTERKVTITDSRPYNAVSSVGSSVGYDFEIDIPATTTIGLWTIQFCTTASGACTLPTGMVTTSAVRSSDQIAGTGRTDDFTVNGTLETDVTTPGTQSTQDDVNLVYTAIRNQTSANTTFFARITTYGSDDVTVLDSGVVASATLTDTSITVSASVDETFTFTVAGVASGGTVNGDTTEVTTTANTVPFATLVAGTEKQAAHDVTVTTNAGFGYLVTIRGATDPPLQSGLNDIDTFTGTNGTPTAWSAPAGTTQNVNTGYFGYTTEDDTLCVATFNRFDGGNWAGPSTTAEEIICESTALSGGTETVRIGWQVEVNSVAAPGTYTGVMILVATPTY